jgi:hypothetical protein
MSWFLVRIIAKAARGLGINLNWIFDPVESWRRREPWWIGL